jgi:hypothetical protein
MTDDAGYAGSGVCFPRLRNAIFCPAVLLALSEACNHYLLKTTLAKHIISAGTFVILISVVQAQ